MAHGFYLARFNPDQECYHVREGFKGFKHGFYVLAYTKEPNDAAVMDQYLQPMYDQIAPLMKDRWSKVYDGEREGGHRAFSEVLFLFDSGEDYKEAFMIAKLLLPEQ